MKKKCLIISILFSLCITFMLSQVYATDATNTQNVLEDIATIQDTETQQTENEEVEWQASDLVAFSENVTVDKVIDGNAFVMGNTVRITGEIGGDLFVLANELIVESTAVIYSSIFACANTINFQGACYDIYASCANFTMGEEAFISRDLKIMSDVCNLNGMINRNIYGVINTINMADTTVINGDVQYTSSTEQSLVTENIKGEVKYTPVKEVTKSIADYIIDLVSSILFTLVIALFILFLAPKFSEKLTNMKIKEIGIALGVAILAIFITFIAFIALLCTGFTANIGMLLLGIMLLLFIISAPIGYVIIGKLIAKKIKWEGKGKELGMIVLVSIAAWALYYIPIFGSLLMIVITLLGLGSLVTQILPSKEK